MYKMNLLKKMLVTAVLSVTVFISYSQKTVEYNSYVQSASSTESVRIVELLTQIQPTIYLERGAEKVTGNGVSSVLVTDANSISSLANVLKKSNGIELIEIRLKNRNEASLAKIDAELIRNNGNIKAILIRAEFDMSDAEFKALFKSFKNSTVELIYHVSIPN